MIDNGHLVYAGVLMVFLIGVFTVAVTGRQSSPPDWP